MNKYCLDISKGKPFPTNEWSQTSDGDFLHQCREKLIDEGFIVPAGPLDVSGEFCRVGDDKKPNSKNCSYVIQIEKHYMYCYNFRTNHEFECRGNRGTSGQNFHLAKSKRLAQNKLKKSVYEDEFRRIWGQAEPVNCHPYSVKKRIKLYLARQSYQRLVLPLLQIDGTLSGLQYIDASSKKRFPKGCTTKGSFCPIKMTVDSTPILFCEGYATGCTLHEATNLPTVITFSSGNLPVVVKQFHHKFPERHIVICADNDHVQEAIDGVNAGLKAAMEAHQIAGGTICIPQFPLGDTGSDFNDIHVKYGLDFVRKLLSSVINREC
jgi:hypothetical protein